MHRTQEQGDHDLAELRAENERPREALERLLAVLEAQGHYRLRQTTNPDICGECSRFYAPIPWPCSTAQAIAKAKGEEA
jgi:hypothetical protein